MSTAARPRSKRSFVALILVLVVGALFIPLASSPAYAVENDGSNVQLQAQSLNVETSAISYAPNNAISMYEVYSTYLFFNPGLFYCADGRVFMAIRPAGGDWKYYGPMQYRAGRPEDGYTIGDLTPNTLYEAKLYYRDRYGYGTAGPYSNPVFFKTGPNALPKVKSVKVQAVKVKRHKEHYVSPYTGYVYRTIYNIYYTFKYKITVTMKKKPGTPYLYVNGKRFKGNKKKYTVTTGKQLTYYKPKGKKFTVYVYTGLDPTYGGYSLLYSKNVKVK